MRGEGQCAVGVETGADCLRLDPGSPAYDLGKISFCACFFNGELWIRKVLTLKGCCED